MDKEGSVKDLSSKADRGVKDDAKGMLPQSFVIGAPHALSLSEIGAGL